MIYEYVVIGGGVSGLTAATILAQQGSRVALVEKWPRLAPILRGFSRQGVRFDTGFHYSSGLGRGEILDRFFQYLGIAGDIETYAFNQDGFDVFRDISGSGDFRFPFGYGPLQEALCGQFPKEAQGIAAYLAAVRKASGALPYLNLEIPFGERGSMGGIHGASLSEILGRFIQDPALKHLLSLHCLLYGVLPEEVPFSMHAGVVGLYYQSVHGIKGGGLALVRAFEKRLTTLGVDLFTGRPVKAIRLADGGSFAGVELVDGEILDCRACISTVHPKVLLDLVPETSLRPIYRRRLQELEETFSAYMLYAQCDAPVRLLQDSNLFLGRYPTSSNGLTAGALEQRTLYLSGAAAEGGEQKQGLIAICPADMHMPMRWGSSTFGYRPAEYLRFKDEIMEQMLRHIESACPELRGSFSACQGATPLTFRHYAGTPEGGLYGVKHKVGQYNPQPLTRIPGLYLAGQAVAGPGVLGGALSGFLACGHILGHDLLRKGLLACN